MKVPFGITDGKKLERFEKGKEAEQFLDSDEPLPEKPLDLRALAGMDDQSFNRFMTSFGISYSKQKIKTKDRRDRVAIQVVEALGDLDKVLNLFSERLREWYSLHYPELDEKIDDHRKFARLVAKYGERKNFPDFDESFGQEFSKEDVSMAKEHAKSLSELYQLKEDMSGYLEKLMKEIAPNTTKIAGAVIGARLISHTGGLESLAKKPASTIQILGAEKALFRHLKGKGKAPRFGLLYSHPMIKKTKEDKKGKVARLLSSKIAIAARLDCYGDRDKGDELLKELKKKVKKA